MGAKRTETTFRLDPAKHRRLRITLAERGISVQKALEQALELWLETPVGQEGSTRDFLRWQGALAGSAVLEEHEGEHREELRRDDDGA